MRVTSRDLARELAREDETDRVDVLAAAIDALTRVRARASPWDVVVGLNFIHDDDEASTPTYDEREANAIRAYVKACPFVLAAFERTAHESDGRIRCSKFARGLSEREAAEATAWRRARASPAMLALDEEVSGRAREGALGRAGGRRAVKTGGGNGGGGGEDDATRRARARVVVAPAPAPTKPAWTTGTTATAGTTLRDIMATESARSSGGERSTSRRVDASSSKGAGAHVASMPKFPVITAELLRSESRLSPMDKFGKVRCRVCGRSFKAYDALEQHIGASHFGLNNPYAKVLESARIAAGLAPSGKDRINRVSLKLGDLVSSESKTSNSMVNSLAAYFKTEKTKHKSVEKKEGNVHGGQMVRSTNAATSTGMVLRRGVERKDGKKKRHSTLKKIILRERTMRREEETKKLVEEEVEVEIEVRVNWVYVRVSYEDDACRVRLMCMEEDEDDDDEDDEMGEDEEVSARDPDAREKLETLDERAPAGAWGARSLLAVLKTKDESAEDAKKKTQTVVKAKQTPRTCEVCDVQCFGERAWEEHVKGKAHAKKVALRDDPAAAKKLAAARAASGTTYVGETGAESVRYAEQIITNELNESTKTLLSTLKRFQDRLYHTDKIKAKQRRRLLYGLREVAKSVDAGTSKVIILAPNIEKIESEGGLDDRINEIIERARENGVPIVVALTKRRVGKALGIPSAVSVVSVLDYDGADEEFKRTVRLAAEGRALYVKAQKRGKEDETTRVVASTFDLGAKEFVPASRLSAA